MQKLMLIGCLLIVSCNNFTSSKHQDDDFYTDKGSFDMARIPLIKPYEATTPSTNVNWVISSIDTNSVPITIDGTKEIKVTKGLILIHSINTTLNYQPVKEAWFIILPKKRIIRGFSKHKDYLGLLDSSGIKNEPKLYQIGKVFNYFDMNDTINWEEIH